MQLKQVLKIPQNGKSFTEWAKVPLNGQMSQ